ncbi:CobD/CbiB family cobalamin biosynthesis protein [Robbsia andropogonis]|uniref:CobD/CbiB family cobalamin biosynthesis protein n=1 Tax=Robbsia andropogonis TaxID=28092 RepID=UPI003D245938
MIGAFSFLTGSLLALAAVAVDRCLGEPARWHPLIGVGRVANGIERAFNRKAPSRTHHVHVPRCGEHECDDVRAQSADRAAAAISARMRGFLGWACVVLPPTAAAAFILHRCPWPIAALLHVLLLWFALGARSLRDHIAPVAQALARADLMSARAAAARVVSRDLTHADETAVAKAAVESTLENGSDAIFAPLFWFLIGGGPAALAYRLINTLDAMWGYRTPRLLHYGWAAARIDDIANWIPARLTAMAYLALGAAGDGWRCWQQQAPAWDSPNAGPVMAAGAGSLQVQLGGTARYHGRDEHRPLLGCGAPPMARDVTRALALVQRTLLLWLAIAMGIGVTLALWPRAWS